VRRLLWRGGSAPNGHAPKMLTEEEREKATRGR
jgi:hypothetical protein